MEGRGKPRLAFFVSLRVSPLRRRPKGFPVALWKPSGFHPLRGMEATKNGFFVGGRGKPRLAFFVSLRVSPLRRRPKGFPVALWKPSGFHLLRRTGGLQKINFLWKARENPALLFCFAEGFASAEATKGLSGRPLETFGVPPLERDGGSTKNGFFVEGRGKPRLAFLALHRVSLLQGNYDQTVNNRQEINKTAKFVDFSASPRDQSIARGWQKFL